MTISSEILDLIFLSDVVHPLKLYINQSGVSGFSGTPFWVFIKFKVSYSSHITIIFYEIFLLWIQAVWILRDIFFIYRGLGN